MDKKTAEILRKISASIPKEMLKKAYQKVDNSDMYKAAERVLSSTTDKQARQKLEADIASGAMARNRMEVNQKEAKKIDAYLEAKVQSALKSGDIKPAERDAFIKKVDKK